MDQVQLWQLMSAHLAGESTVEEAEALNAVLLADPRLRQRLELLKAIWASKLPTKEDTRAAFSRVLRRIKPME